MGQNEGKEETKESTLSKIKNKLARKNEKEEAPVQNQNPDTTNPPEKTTQSEGNTNLQGQLSSIKNKLSKKKAEDAQPQQTSNPEIIQPTQTNQNNEANQTAQSIQANPTSQPEPQESKLSMVIENTITAASEYEYPQELTTLLKSKEDQINLKRDILHEVAKDLFSMYKIAWAKPSISPFLSDLIYKRDIFTPEQQVKLQDLMANLNSLKYIDKSKGLKREFLDSNILNNPLQSMNEVRDGRVVSFSTNGLDKWTSKQCGL